MILVVLSVVIGLVIIVAAVTALVFAVRDLHRLAGRMFR